MAKQRVKCPYCGGKTALVTGEVIYPYRPDLHGKHYWLCQPCNAWVGCHPDSTRPMGVPADAKTRQARMRAHEAFDPIWRTGRMTRRKAYDWLAAQMGLPVKATHISWFDQALCQQVLAICQRYWAQERQVKTIASWDFSCPPTPFVPQIANARLGSYQVQIGTGGVR